MSIDLTQFVDRVRDIIFANHHQEIASLVGATFPTKECIKHAYLNDNRITTLAGVTFPDNLTLINLRNNQITSLAGVTFSTKLTDLILSGNRIASLAGVVFPTMLRELDLSDNALTTLEGVVFPDSLRELNLSGNAMDLTHGNFQYLGTLLLSLNALTHTIANNESINKKTYNNLKIHINGKTYTEFTIKTVDFSQPPSKVAAWDLSHASSWEEPAEYQDGIDNTDAEYPVKGYESDGDMSDGGKKRQSKIKIKSKSKSKSKSKRQSKRQSKSKSQSKRKSNRNKLFYSKN